MKFKKYTANNNEILLYTGEPNLLVLEELITGPGDLWHSSLDQGFKNCFEDLIYQTAVFWWFLNDFENVKSCINWRVNYDGFVIRESIWNKLKGIDIQYDSKYMSGLDLGYNLLRNSGGVSMYVKGLYSNVNKIDLQISPSDRYLFFFKNFKTHHAYYMLIRKGVFNFFVEYKALVKAKKKAKKVENILIKPRELKPVEGQPSVSLVVPTMKRQKHAQLLLEDHRVQTYLIKEVVIVDATPENERDEIYYNNEDFPFDVKVKWQTSKGSCRARNEAISMCSGDYIIFADDDIRILPDFVENHIKLLQTYKAAACNGLDIMAKHVNQDLDDLKERLKLIDDERWRVGVSSNFSNANSCIRKDLVDKLIGNDVNFDGGYGEDSDFGLSILKTGGVVLFNPFSPNLHLKPAVGGYRWWGKEANKIGKKRKQQPWELDSPVNYIKPVPSPTITYGILKHFKPIQVREWRLKYFFIYLFKDDLKALPIRLLKLPYRQLQFSKSLFYAKKLIKLGKRYK